MAALYAVTLGQLGDDPAVRGRQALVVQRLQLVAHELNMAVLPSMVSIAAVRQILAAAKMLDSRLLGDRAGLAALVDLIEHRGAEAESWPLISPRIMDCVTRVLEDLPASDRPAIAVFIDTFEKIQTPQGRTAEQMINALVVHLPLCLFVVTGREPLTWHLEESRHLRWFGPERWPTLLRFAPDDDEPRQHLLAHLTVAEAKLALRNALDQVEWDLGEGDLTRLAKGTQGWPLHIEILINLIHERHQHGKVALTYRDLRGSFPTLVRRLLEHLPSDVQLALQAAAVTASFSPEMLRMCDPAIRHGSVVRLLRTSLVGPTGDPFFPHKIHDELRHAIRAAGSDVDGGWDAEDSRDAAKRLVIALAEARSDAKQHQRHAELMHLHTFAVQVCLEHDLDIEWVKQAFLSTPSHKYQRDLLPSLEGTTGRSELHGLVQIYRWLGVEDFHVRLAALQDISATAVSDRVRFRADLWTMYALRSLRRYDEAVALGKALLTDPYDQNCGDWRKPTGLIRAQHAGTLTSALRWGELFEFDPPDSFHCWTAIQDAHGNFTVSAERSRDRLAQHIAAKKSYRFQMELQSEFVWRQLRAGQGLALPELDEVVRFRDRYSTAWLTASLISHVGPWAVAGGFADAQVLWDRLTEIGERHGSGRRGDKARFAVAIAELIGDKSYAQESRALFSDPQDRQRENLYLDFVFDHLDMPIPPARVEWLDDVDAVRERWIAGWRRMVAPPPEWQFTDEVYGWMITGG